MFNSEEIVAAAHARTGVASFHSESFREGLDLLVDQIGRAPLATDSGRALLMQQYIDALSTRLRLDDYIARHPEVLGERIERPVFILGMPRTGTTMVSSLLGTDPARRSLLKWQIAEPVPPASPADLRSDPRCLAMLAAEAAVRNPIAAIHDEAADEPSECTFVVAQDFKSLVCEAQLAMPDYSRWILSVDAGSAYTHHKRFLQALQSTGRSPWALKMPSHALFVRDLLAAYPDARLIWTHRDPYTVTGSLCSLIAGTQSIFNDHADLDFIAGNYPRQLAEHVGRPMEVRAERGTDSMYDLHYAALMRDPLGEMRRFYRWLGDDFTPEAEAGMRRWLDANPQHKRGSHRYSLDRFGLDVTQLRPLFADYVETYGVTLDVPA